MGFWKNRLLSPSAFIFRLLCPILPDFVKYHRSFLWNFVIFPVKKYSVFGCFAFLASSSFLRKFTLCLYSYSVFCAYSKFAKFCDYSRRAVQNTFTIQVLRFVIFSRSALFESWFRALPYPGMTIAGGCLKITQQFSGNMLSPKYEATVRLVTRLI